MYDGMGLGLPPARFSFVVGKGCALYFTRGTAVEYHDDGSEFRIVKRTSNEGKQQLSCWTGRLGEQMWRAHMLPLQLATGHC